MIVFVIAMEREAKAVLDNMRDISENFACGKHIFRGKLCGSDTAVVVTGVGKVNAACGTQYAIDVLGATKIINAGFAGGLNSGTETGRIYGICAAVQYDFDLVQLNGTKIGTLDEFKEPYLPLRTAGGYPLKRAGTGDRFNDSPEDYRLLTEELGADIRDMELGAIAQTCAHAAIELYAFKVISDVAGSGSTTEQFLKNLDICEKNLGAALPDIFTEAQNG